MAVQVPRGTILAVGSFNATGNATSANWAVNANTNDITTLADDFERHNVGIKSLSVAFTGFNDHAAAAWDEYSRANAGSAQIVSLGYAGSTAGSGVVIANGIMPGKQSFTATVGGVPAISPTIVGGTVVPVTGEGLITRAASSGTITATTNTTPVEVGALTAAKYVVAAVHVFSYSGTGTITCQLQSAATSGGSYTNRGSAGAAISAAGTQWITATGLTVTDTFWRLAITASSSPVALVLASIAIVTL
jgi:hypothetical protein